MNTVFEAQDLLRQGRKQDAEQAYRKLLDTDPDNVEALAFLAGQAMERGRPLEALPLLERARALAPEDATLQLRIGRAHEAHGDSALALAAYEAALRLDPEFSIARLHLGSLLDLAGSTDRALIHFSRALKEAQMRGRWLNRATTPENLLPMVERAVHRVRNGRHKLLFDLLEPLAAQHGREALKRVETCLRVYLEEEVKVLADPRQQPSFLYFPGLPTSPYIDRVMSPWIDEMEAQTDAIRAELLNVLGSDKGRERVFGTDELEAAYLSSTVDPPSWNGYYFYRHGERREANHAACPRTSAALDRLPLSRVPAHGPESLFSVFTPGTHLALHRGVTNTRVVGHLPLIIPPDCAINVGGEVHAWKEGRIVVFDDTYEHEAWNHSKQTRVVLIFDLWNPHLSEVERLAVRDIVTAIGGFREQVDEA